MSVITEADDLHLQRAVDLAALGGDLVSPNPHVGAVIVQEGRVIGEGFHREVGGPHAEVEAIRAAGEEDLAGATLYVSLEPCCHQGRTPACTDAIREAGIGRVVVASDDPSEHASGRGLGILRDEGIEVVVASGELAARARLQNQPFRKHARTGRPWVLFKSAMSLDGKVATRSGDSKWISGVRSRKIVHEWRAASDAVAIGIGTALADNPVLTARVGGSDSSVLAGRQPRRVLFDSLAQLPLTARLLDDTATVPLTVVVSRAAPRAATDALENRGVEVICATGENEPARVRSALDQLGAADVTSMLLEGGPKLAGVFLDAGEIDEIRLFIAPLLLGGRGAPNPLESEGAESVSEAVRSLTLECERIDEDLLLTARIKEW
ncbi:MAG TPA: bifunctional diaminohydroxyphosphoribosylaminopyrimidine deaminase/5-amino-6-(5-phosphoribosylamino)uracil reductase RibD [Solirubrobacteraceae bacterium]|nr:bifunctional diaminohydroxyphosphoribosylaminopyrimidine deaminase/5-amino-6-(5-phosphoribosylamino)uracil reductase RibD [Solirubrobacteraceae bacterium]